MPRNELYSSTNLSRIIQNTSFESLFSSIDIFNTNILTL